MTATTAALPQVECLYDSQPPVIKVEIRRTPFWKRTVDVCGSAFLIVALLPLFAVISVFIKIVSRGPVLFKQERIGVGTKGFVIYKFRTMTVNDGPDLHRDYVAQLARSNSQAQKPCYRNRLIYGGALLRALSLDELPQLFNVLIGNMSLIGPRPEVLRLEDYQPWQLRRFEVLPGISGLWQVSGKNRLTFKQMIELDIRYVDNLSLRLDILIMLKTVKVILTRSNH
ncbi:MAG: sugar transferase [Planctomycetales bacterium]|nr:sugar transferase [Planctomycetales bacterium]